ncbi:MAG: methyltransferase domain-containing protein [Rhodothermales bacterium]
MLKHYFNVIPPMDLFFEIHRDLPREAPGSDACTARALAMAPPLPNDPHILDIGCGPGAHTLVLATQTGGHVTAIDTHQPYLDELTRRAEQAHLASRIRAQYGDMFALDFEDASFDLIWSEGAIYIIGFREGLAAWHRFLKPGGALAVTELTWLVDDPPDEARRVWQAAYPAMKHVEENVAILQEAGYTSLGHFPLPESAWWDHYYTPIEHRIAALRQRYQNDAEALAVLDEEQREIDLYRRYSSSYGYVFYIMVNS